MRSSHDYGKCKRTASSELRAVRDKREREIAVLGDADARHIRQITQAAVRRGVRHAAVLPPAGQPLIAYN